MTSWLRDEVMPYEHRTEHVLTAVYEHCRSLRIEPPTASRIERIAGSARQQYEALFFARTLERLPYGVLALLDALLNDGDIADSESTNPARATLLDLRTDPGNAGLESVLDELAKLERIRQLHLPPSLFGDVPARVLEELRQRAASEPPTELRRHPPAIRYTLLAALCWLRGQEITDTLVELLVQLVHQVGARAERRVERELVQDLRRVTGKTSILYQLAEAAVEHPDGIVRDVLYPIVGEPVLRQLVKEFKASGPAYPSTCRPGCATPTVATTGGSSRSCSVRSSSARTTSSTSR